MRRFKHNASLGAGGLTRRGLLSATGGIVGASMLGLSGCGGAEEEEGWDYFDISLRLFNAATRESSVTVSSGARTYFDSLPYLTISGTSFRSDVDYTETANVVIRGNSSNTTSTLPSIALTQRLYVLVSGTANGQYTLFSAGGVPGTNPRASTVPNSRIYQMTSLLTGTLDVFTRGGGTAILTRVGSLTNGQSVILPAAAAVSDFQLTLVQNGVTVYDTGTVNKAANTCLFILRTGVMTSTWSLYGIDERYAVFNWTNRV